jgi:predicted nucleic acid binding AN1-type Zn finger protein
MEKDYTQIKKSENKYSVPYEKLNVEKFAKMKKSEKVVYLKKKQLEFKKYHIANFCSYCDKKYNGWTDVHQCRYCDGYFCAMHWVPETHGCNGNPLRPPGGIREVHHIGDKIDVYGK